MLICLSYEGVGNPSLSTFHTHIHSLSVVYTDLFYFIFLAE